MSRKSDPDYLGHMLDAARKAVGKVSGISRQTFDGDENLRITLTHLIQIIGEAASRVSPEGRQEHPEIPWRVIVGMRHRIVHDYLEVDEEVVWQVVTQDLPPLIMALEKIVPPENEE